MATNLCSVNPINGLTDVLTDENGLVIYGKGTSVPTTANVYAPGGLFSLTNVATGGSTLYENRGTSAAPSFVTAGGGVAMVNLSSAQILALSATPVTLVAAQGAGTVINVSSILFKMVTTATQYASGGVVTFQYSGGSAVTNNIAAAVVNAAAGTSYTKRAEIDVTALANTAVTVTNSTGAFTTGTGTAVVVVRYTVSTL